MFLVTLSGWGERLPCAIDGLLLLIANRNGMGYVRLGSGCYVASELKDFSCAMMLERSGVIELSLNIVYRMLCQIQDHPF